MIYLIVIAALLLLIVIGLYNSLVTKKNYVENAFASIDVMLKKRYDLIPNLVETVKSYMKHEKTLLTEITEIRTKALSGEISNDDRVMLENKIASRSQDS
ncbi:MAG TPA: LemA family protein [Bacteroidales bacterium]|nr:LemA family protein [Bacteroidales bacterium]